MRPISHCIRYAVLAVSPVVLALPTSAAPAAPAATKEELREGNARAALGLPDVPRRLALRPTEAEEVRACSERRPVCVHAPRSVATRAIEKALADGEMAIGALEALKLPRPLQDGTRGGDGRFDVYLDPDAPSGALFTDVGSTDLARGSVTAFAVVRPSSSVSCESSARIGTLVAEAALLGLDGATEQGILEMAGRYIGTIVTPCPSAEATEVDTFQRAPERCLASDGHGAQPGSFLFPQYLDDRFGGGVPGAMAFSLVAISGRSAPAIGEKWRDEPDLFDSLRSTLKARETSFGQIMLDFDVARAFVGSRSDDGHMDDVARYGDFGRVRMDWSVPYSALPKRLAQRQPYPDKPNGDALDALGATYIWLDLRDAPPGAEITFAADWETPFLFRWSLVKVDTSGGEQSRADVSAVFGDYHAEKTVRDLAGLAGILVVGENDAEWSKSLPFDPGEPRLLPKGFTVTFYKPE